MAQLEQFATYFGLKLLFLVSGATEQTSQALQFQNTTVSEALEAVKMTKFFYHSRELTAFDRFYSGTV